jgi:succinyl-CoA synthetase beta subunit
VNIHEYQAKQLLARFGVPVPAGKTAATAEEAQAAGAELLAAGSKQVVLKSQIHAGGRGKGTFQSGLRGGIQLCRTVHEIGEFARRMLGHVLVTQQTGSEGRRVGQLLIEPAYTIKREFYLAVLLDRAASRPLVMASTEGGMDIEKVAAEAPAKIVREPVDPASGLMAYQGRKIAVALGFRGDLLAPAARLIGNVYRTWWECDASLVEINPLGLVESPSAKDALVVVDAKIGLDDNGLFRHPDLQALRDLAEESPLETEASRHNLNYIRLDGNIACLVNGAGLAMATMDIIKHHGGNPANFLDVGGGASQTQVAAAFSIILQDPNVQAILVNIFGGIMDCSVIARGIIAAASETGLKLPLVVRLEGNNGGAGKRILADSGLPIISSESMADAAQQVVQAALASQKPTAAYGHSRHS